MSTSEFGYIESPEQSSFNNKGIFTPTDIYNLDRDDKWTQFGQLELIQTQTVSSAVCDFTNLNINKYKLHFFTFMDIRFGSQTEFGYRLSDDEGTSYETGYYFATKRVDSANNGSNRTSTGQDTARLFGDIDSSVDSAGNGYMYLSHAGDSTKYTFSTSHFAFSDNADRGAIEYGGQMYNRTSQITAIRFGAGTALGTMTNATISLYGVRSY